MTAQLDDGAPQELTPSDHTDGPGHECRKDYVTGEDFAFSPGSLIGSWFHRLEDDEMIWQGVVVAEVAAGIYLLHIDKLDEGAEDVQRLIEASSMVSELEGTEYRFYDNEGAARSAYAQWIASERHRA